MAGIYKAYDIRGLYPSEINAEIAAYIGRQLAFILEAGKVILARDGRHGGEELSKAFTKTFVDQGKLLGKRFEIVDVGLSTTPMFYFLINEYGASGGAMITASHNPKEYNGIKAASRKAAPISGAEIEAVRITQLAL